MKADTKFKIKLLAAEDLLLAKKLIALFHDVFEMENKDIPHKSYLNALLSRPGFIAYAVLHENEVIGGLTAYELPMFNSETREIFIYDIGIRETYRRRGLGEQLLATLNAHGRKHGIKEIFVDASQSDKHAVDFYRASGGIPEEVIQFTYLVRRKARK